MDSERLSISVAAVRLKVNEEEAVCDVRGGVAGGPSSCDWHHM